MNIILYLTSWRLTYLNPGLCFNRLWISHWTIKKSGVVICKIAAMHGPLVPRWNFIPHQWKCFCFFCHNARTNIKLLEVSYSLAWWCQDVCCDEARIAWPPVWPVLAGMAGAGAGVVCSIGLVGAVLLTTVMAIGGHQSHSLQITSLQSRHDRPWWKLLLDSSRSLAADRFLGFRLVQSHYVWNIHWDS